MGVSYRLGKLPSQQVRRGVSVSEPKRLGLVAGLGVGAGIFYYKSLVEAHLARGLSPSLLMVHADVRKVMGLADERKAQELAEYLCGLLQQLADGGAELATIPAFSPQIAAAELSAMTPVPLIHVLDAIAAEATRRKLKRAAVFGARVTMETGLFGRLDGCDVIALKGEETTLVSEIYGRVVRAARRRPKSSRSCDRWRTARSRESGWTPLCWREPISLSYLMRAMPIFRIWTGHGSTSKRLWMRWSLIRRR